MFIIHQVGDQGLSTPKPIYIAISKVQFYISTMEIKLSFNSFTVRCVKIEVLFINFTSTVLLYCYLYIICVIPLCSFYYLFLVYVTDYHALIGWDYVATMETQWYVLNTLKFICFLTASLNNVHSWFYMGLFLRIYWV